jgi:hypothetical protein
MPRQKLESSSHRGDMAELRAKETFPDSYSAHIASLRWEHIGFSGGCLWASDPPKHKVSALRKLCSSMLLTLRFRTDSAMTLLAGHT